MKTIEIKLDRIINLLKDDVIKVIGDTNRIISHPASINNAQTNRAITFISSSTDKKALCLGQNTSAGAILGPNSDTIVGLANENKTIIIVENPKLSFLRVINSYFVEISRKGIHPTAVVDSKAKIHEDVFIGPFTYIGKCIIEKGTRIHGHVHIYSDIKIGKNVIVYAGTVIGADGFGYQQSEQNILEHFPHVGGVLIHDNVEIGANTSIDRGCLEDTVIGEGSKIDDSVYIAHNVKIGKNCLIAGGAAIAGSVIIGDNVWIGPNSTVSDHIHIDNGAIITLGSVVCKNVNENQTVTGNFAVEHLKFVRNWQKIRR